MRPHCFARCRPVSLARVLGCTGIAEGVAFSSPAFMRGMYFSTNLILVNAVNHLLKILSINERKLQYNGNIISVKRSR